MDGQGENRKAAWAQIRVPSSLVARPISTRRQSSHVPESRRLRRGRNTMAQLRDRSFPSKTPHAQDFPAGERKRRKGEPETKKPIAALFAHTRTATRTKEVLRPRSVCVCVCVSQHSTRAVSRVRNNL